MSPTLRDPQPDSAASRSRNGSSSIGVCTHLGCIPLGQKTGDDRGPYGGWFCPCHGSVYDTSGRIRQGPGAAEPGRAALRIHLRHRDQDRLGERHGRFRPPPRRNAAGSSAGSTTACRLSRCCEHELYEYPTPRNLSYWWNFGSLAGIMLVVMIVTGMFLAMQYTPHADLAFDSVERIMRDVNYGWLLRYIHMNGASMFFADRLHPHVPRALLRFLQVPARAVVDSRRRHPDADDRDRLHGLCAALGADELLGGHGHHQPVLGDPVDRRRSIVTLLWGGFTVGNPTLNRFYSLHYLLPFVIVAVVLLHLIALHRFGSNNPLGIDMQGAAGHDAVPPLLHDQGHVRAVRVSADLCVLRVLCAEFLGSSDNYIPANPMQTPNHIVPEWYLLPYYAILRSVTSILGIPASCSASSWRSGRSSCCSSCRGSTPRRCAAPASGRSTNGCSGSW